MSRPSPQRPEPAETRVTATAERLLALLPGLYRAKDDALRQDHPLPAFLRVLARELARLEEAILALDDDHFVERASPAALPLLAELYGARLLGGDPRINRGVIARSVGWRRRRGTLAALEEMLSVTSGWAVDVREGYRSLMVTQDVGHVVLFRGRTASLWDPIALADPIARRTPIVDHRRDPGAAPETTAALSRAPGETVDAALYRLGRADAGRPAVSPRTPNLCGWARPEGVLVRAVELVPVELEGMRCHDTLAPDGRRVIALDPLGRPTPLVWLEPTEAPELLGGLTAAHEPDLSAPPALRRSAALLTPTALAADADAAEAAGALELAVAGVPIVGPPRIAASGEALSFAPLGAAPELRFADPSRPAPGDRFLLELFAARSDAADPDPLVDRLVASAEASFGSAGPVASSDDSQLEIGGAKVVLRVTRVAGEGRARRAAGGGATWTALATGPRTGQPLGAAVAVTVDGARLVVRPEIAGGATVLQLGALAADGASPWRALPITGARVPPVEGIGVAADGAIVYLAVADGAATTLYQLEVGADSATATRLDDPGLAQQPPAARARPALLVHDGRVFVHGGERLGAALGDLWSFSLVERRWRSHLARNKQRRLGATLLWQDSQLVLLGGQSIPGELDVTAFVVAPDRPRPVWTALPPLPIAPHLPGQLVARVRGDAVDALIWADRTLPCLFTLSAAPHTWTPDGAPRERVEAGATNPPADGDALYAGDDVLVVGAPPLPPSEVLFSLGGQARLAFLPALDLADGEGAAFSIAEDGGARRRLAPGQLSRPRGPWAEDDTRAAGPFRLGVPGRLSSYPFALRQRCYGPWDAPIAFTDAEGVVGLDPRNGRVVLPSGAPAGAITASYRVGRGGLLGAGAMPRDRRPASFWEDPGGPAPTPPDLAPGGPAATAYVHPTRAGQTQRRRNADVLIYPTAERALAGADRDGAQPILGVLGSPRFDPASLASSSPRGFSLFAVDHGHAPLFAVDPAAGDDRSLGVYPDFGGTAATEVWLAGLWLEGRLDLVMARGAADIRYSTMGRPGDVALRVPGGGHEAPADRRALHAVELEIRLYGCMLGAIELPPWARLIAAGCTFDGGAGGRAIHAAGAEVRLRHCTVRGAVEAGELYASSCAFGGPVRAARADVGWIRHSLLPTSPRQPRLYHAIDHRICFASVRPTDPSYLVVADNNGPTALAAGEDGRVPGAHGERSDRLRELRTRTELHLPIGMAPTHLDRVTQDLARMGRSSP